GMGARAGEAKHFLRLIRPWAPLLAAPSIYVLLQAVPLPYAENPIWRATRDALNEPVLGFVSVDPGSTLRAFGVSLLIVTLTLVAAVTSIEPRRAQRLLFVLIGTSVIAALVLFFGSFGLRLDRSLTAVLLASSALGFIFCAAGCLYVVERMGIERTEPKKNRFASLLMLVIFSAAAAICALALLRVASSQAIFATACGFVVLGALVVARRLGVGFSVASGIVFVPILLALFIAAAQTRGSGDATIRFASTVQAAAIGPLVADASIFGSGAGTLGKLLPIYGIHKPSDFTATAASILTVEIGRAGLGLLALVAICATLLLIRGAIVRNRYSYFPAAAASSIILVGLGAFVDSSLFKTPILILLAAVVGLGLAQSVSRTL
ncbi:MAG TPA: hypothetical protein VE999_13875, partial [Gemmataceae bacterium]|nr:hypothetical protein [Gemmataceae bacterium]